MSNPRNYHTFWPNRRGVCQMIVGSSLCHLPENDPVHQRGKEKEDSVNPTFNIVITGTVDEVLFNEDAAHGMIRNKDLASHIISQLADAIIDLDLLDDVEVTVTVGARTVGPFAVKGTWPPEPEEK